MGRIRIGKFFSPCWVRRGPEYRTELMKSSEFGDASASAPRFASAGPGVGEGSLAPPRMPKRLREGRQRPRDFDRVHGGRLREGAGVREAGSPRVRVLRAFAKWGAAQLVRPHDSARDPAGGPHHAGGRRRRLRGAAHAAASCSRSKPARRACSSATSPARAMCRRPGPRSFPRRRA